MVGETYGHGRDRAKQTALKAARNCKGEMGIGQAWRRAPGGESKRGRISEVDTQSGRVAAFAQSLENGCSRV